MKNFFKLLLTTFLFTSTSIPQWGIGGSYITKNQYPYNGFGVNINRDLPFQWPNIGFRIRIETDFFKAKDIFENTNFQSIISYNLIDENISLIGVFFPRYIFPYVGISTGLSFLQLEKFDPAGNSINVSEKEKIMFNLGLIGGVQLSIFNSFSPFIEARLLKYFGTFDEFEFNREISELQLLASFGVILKLDFIE